METTKESPDNETSTKNVTEPEEEPKRNLENSREEELGSIDDKRFSNKRLSSTPKKVRRFSSKEDSSLREEVTEQYRQYVTHRVVFLCDVVRAVFSVICRGLLLNSIDHDSDSANAMTANMLSLLREFDACGGYDVIIRFITQSSYPIFEASRASKATSASAHPTGNLSVITNLFSAFQRTIHLVQKCKVELMHSSCARHRHRNCELAKFIPVHHEVLGPEMRTDFDDTR